MHENAEREELARLYTPPSFFREEMADSPYTTQEREEAVAFVLQHADKRPKVCLCFGANNAMFSTSSSVTNGGKKKLVSKHYRRLALLVHPDKHKSSNNKTGGYGTRSGRRGGKVGDTGEMEKKASDAFNLLHAAYQKVLKMV